jgi:hypothetical protein
VLSGDKKAAEKPERQLREAAGNLKTRREKEARHRLVRQLENAERRRDEELARELYARATELRRTIDRGRQPKE